jgi:hypothetical protein
MMNNVFFENLEDTKQAYPELVFKQYQKIVPTTMARVDGPFVVETSEGPLSCDDGYIAFDARGYNLSRGV